MRALKLIGYLIAAVAVLTVLASGGLLIILAGIVIGIILDLVGATLFTAGALKAYMNSGKKK